MSSTKQTTHNNPDLTRRAALTTPPGALNHLVRACAMIFILTGFTPSLSLAWQLDSSFFVYQRKKISPALEWAVFRGPDLKVSDETWVTQMKLCISEDSEHTWRDITPAPMPGDWIQTVFFLDRLHGWMFVSDTVSEDLSARYYLLSTADGGRNWQTQKFRLQSQDLMIEGTSPSEIFFLDAKHGWILWHWHMMNSDRDYLFVTTDNGETWKRLPDPPGAGPMVFVSKRNGWMICASEGQEGILINEVDALCLSHDGGDHWERVNLHTPKRYFGQRLQLENLEFQGKRMGQVSGGVYSEPEGKELIAFRCQTKNGGKKWHCFVARTDDKGNQ